MRKNTKSDRSAGNEGIDDPAISRDHRDDLDQAAGVSTRLTTGSEMMGADKQGSSTRKSGSKQTGRTDEQTERGSGNDRQQGRESTDNNSRSFSGQGDQREGAEEPEGTGYTNDSSHDTGDSGNPLT